jgi:hypothetical protein
VVGVAQHWFLTPRRTMSYVASETCVKRRHLEGRSRRRKFRQSACDALKRPHRLKTELGSANFRPRGWESCLHHSAELGKSDGSACKFGTSRPCAHTMCWLFGPAGAGKSTTAHTGTIAERFGKRKINTDYQNGRLTASLLFPSDTSPSSYCCLSASLVTP